MGSSKGRRPCSGHSPAEEINIDFKISNTVSMKVKRSDTIKSLKEMICRRVHIPVKLQCLLSTDELLKDGQTLVDCGINKDSTLDLFILHGSSMRVFVKMPSKEETIMLEVEPCVCIQNIKTMIQTKAGIQSYQFSLYLAGKKLNDDSFLLFERDPTLHLVFNPRDVLSICVKTQTGSIEKLEVKLLHTVEVIKTIVGSMTGDPVNDFRLSYEGKELEDCKTLAYYDIKEESILDILSPLIEISVKDLTGKTVTLNVEAGITVKDLKDKIFKKIEYPVNMQRILYAGRMLQDEKDLASYNIQKGSILHVVLRLRGPCLKCPGIKPEPA